MVKLSLIVPCYNEQGNVERFLEEAKAEIGAYTDSYEIVFVNDGSRDNTASELRRIFNENKDVKIKVVTFSRNFGKEAAILAGFKNSSGEYITIIDADLQQSPRYVVEMAEILDKNPDCDIVSAYQEKRKEGKALSFFKGCFYKLISSMSKIDFVQDASDFRTMRRCVADTIVALPEYHRFSKGIFSWVGFSGCSIPYQVRERQQGETKWSLRKLIAYAIEGLIAYSSAPLKMPLYLAVVLLILCTVSLFTGFMICACVLFVGALLMLCLGVMGAYLGRVHTQVKQRPIFITKEILSYDTTD